jgi:hypothetical protein
MFADKYIAKQQGSFDFEEPQWDAAYDMLVVIPCYNESGIEYTLESLMKCDKPDGKVSVLAVVNAPEGAPCEINLQNAKTLSTIEKLKSLLPEWMGLGSIYAPGLPLKHAGAGLARKIGMDTAIKHFNKYNKAHGIIISLDADTTVQPNYFRSIESYFEKHAHSPGATINFEHPLNNKDTYDAICLYELNMRYYRFAMEHSGFPHAIYTVGSAFAVKAGAYVAQGGMNKKKAGEDFYFLHKLSAMGKIGFINQTMVFPSARVSGRVPFGTGPAIQKYLNGNRSLEYTYPLEAFQIVSDFFDKIEGIYTKHTFSVNDLSSNVIFKEFLKQSGFIDELHKLKMNCSSLNVFSKRFFQLFNAFKLLKWLNFACQNGLVKRRLSDEALQLLIVLGQNRNNLNHEASLLLNIYRKLDTIRK